MRVLFVLALILIPSSLSQFINTDDENLTKCPQYWLQFQSSCYRFIKSPLRSRNDARKNCQAYEADLVSISTLEEHSFLIYQLLIQDPQHRKWYIGARQQSPGYWVNDFDGTSLSEMEPAFLPESESYQTKDYLIYSFSNNLKRWGFERVNGEEPYLYICEVPVSKLHYLVVDDRDYQYGIDIDDPDKIPRGPYFIKQPKDVVFDITKRRVNDDVSLSCLAGGYPTPTYNWFKEEYKVEHLTEVGIDPLSDPRYTISGGTLIINSPRQTQDRGSYHCKASNDFGSIVSESITLSFGSIGEFNSIRPSESGNENWGKAIFCDPPQHYPGVKYYWSRESFPNFVEEDERVFVSYDGALYFSSLEQIDQGNYSCTVQSQVSDTGRNGPFFPLRVTPHSNYQQLKFPNNFPKVFPEAPVAGKDVRLECVAFGYPVPSYNWTRKGAPLPRNAQASSYNRVLTLTNVQVEDQGEYVCRASNDRAATKNSVILSIQAEPNFTIPLSDKHVDNKADLTWICEAFGIPDVNYKWLRNGEPLEIDRLSIEDRDRYTILDNVLTIRYLDPDRDPAMYQCMASNILSAKYSSAQLRVLSLKPNFRKRPLEPESYAGERGNVTIICNPEAAPRPKFTWRKDDITIGSGGKRRILENGNLVISPVSRDDDGIYTCKAENMYGMDESKGRLIVIESPTLIEEFPPKIVTSVGRDVHLYCRASSSELLDLAYIWTFNSMDITKEQFRIEIDQGHFLIRNITFAEAGKYECILMSAVGKISTKTNIVVEGPPGPPGGVQVLQISKHSAIIQWTDGANNGRAITNYTIAGKTQWNSTWFVIEEGITAREIDRYTGRKETAIEKALTPYSMYEFRVQATNNLGTGVPSPPSPRYNTLNDAPYKAPSNIGGGGGKIGDLLITWDPLSPDEQNAPGIHYKVFWRKNGTLETVFQSAILKDHGNVGSAVVGIPLDDYYTKYDVRVQAINSEGDGPVSNITTIFSAEDMPLVAPQQVSARSFNSTSVNVSWTGIEMTRDKIRGKLIGHRLKYWKKDNREEDAVYYLSRTTKPWSLIVGLQPDTYYYVKVMAYNSAGEGPESERFLEKTYRKAPQKPPSSVNVIGVNPSIVKVVWRYVQPSLEEEPLIGYKVRVWEKDQDLSSANDTIIFVGNTLEVNVNNLSPGKVYNLRVLAYSNGGDGRMSSPEITFQMGNAADYRSVGHKCYSTFLLLPLAFVLLQFSH